jgi:feruloyl esterase
MKSQQFLILSALLREAHTLPCTASAFEGVLGSRGTVRFANALSENATFRTPASDIGFPGSPTKLPALCTVELNITDASSGSHYSFGLFLPDDWNGRFLATGNSGFAGGINYADMGAGVQYGFAAMGTDTGHNSTSADGTWAWHNPEAVTNWGYRAMHGSVVLAKEVINAYYGKKAAYSYYNGCSTGGRQGLKEAQMFPEDFDGIVAGAPAWWTAHLQLWNMQIGIWNLPLDSSGHVPPNLFNVIGAEVLRQCDGQDGVADSIISDPRGCDFRLETLLCGAAVKNETTSGCLTPQQLDTIYKFYRPWTEANSAFIFPGLELGSEAQWPFLAGTPQPTTLGTDYVKYWLGLGSNWTWADFTPDIISLSERINPGNSTAWHYDMSAFQERGGKLLMYHGFADALIATGSSIYFYDQVRRAMYPKGIDLDQFYRLFLIPGMQ